MTPVRANPLAVAPKLAVSLAAALAVVTGGMVLAGWALDITALKSILPGWVSVKPNTALAFILTGIALLFSSLAPTMLNLRLSAFLSGLARLCGLLAGLIGFATLCEYVFDWNPGIDQWLFPEPAGTVGTSNPGRMAPETALCFVLLAAGLEIARGSYRRTRTALTPAIIGALVTALALAAILTYFTPALGAYGWWGRTIMAVPTATLFAILGAAMVLVARQHNVSIWSLDGRITVTFVCGLVLLVIMGLTTSRSQVLLHETSDQRTHSEQVLGGIARILAEVANAQTQTRGYVITGDERFLKATRSADSRGKEALDALRRLVAGSPTQQPRFIRLEAKASEAFQWFRQVADIRRTGPAAVHPDQIRHGEDLMDDIRAEINQIDADERESLQQTNREWESVSSFTDTIIVAGTVLSLIIFLTALLVLNRTLAQRTAVQIEIRKLNEGLESRIRERTAQLEATNARLEQFAYVASHDLQEPLRMVTSYIQLMEKRLADRLDAETREFMGFAVDGALRMQALIQDILAYSRVGTRGQPLEPVDSAEALKEALDRLANRIAETGADVDAQSLPVVMADRTQLVQLFQNLIGNAIKFCKGHAPRVRVEAVHEAGWWRFSVTDNGIGIAPEYRERLFVVFKRLHTRREFSGTGIGLAICKSIVERHGGEIGIGPAPGGGSVFWFTLPEETGK